MSGLSAEQRNQLIERILGAVDPRLATSVRAEFARPATTEPPHATRTVAIGGHRAAGKSRLLPLVSALLGRPGLDLDVELERRTGRSLREWVATDTEGFRAAERGLFLSLPPGSCVAVVSCPATPRPSSPATPCSCPSPSRPIASACCRTRVGPDCARACRWKR